jgi:hypothetical protein
MKLRILLVTWILMFSAFPVFAGSASGKILSFIAHAKDGPGGYQGEY